MYKKIATLCSLALFAAAVPMVSYATPVTPIAVVTLDLKSTDGSIYPYDFNITNGSKTTDDVALSCLNDTRSVYVGETWSADEYSLSSLTAGLGLSGTVDSGQTTVRQLDEQAFLDQLYSNTTSGDHTVVLNNVDVSLDNQDVQDAIWDLQDSSDYSKLDSLQKALVGDAIGFIGSSGDTSSFLSQFDVYIPASGYCSGEQQQFLQFTPNGANGLPPITPEPSSLALLGTGILGAAGLFRKRMAARNQA